MDEGLSSGSFWIDPNGKLIDLKGIKHIDHILKHPAKYGFTKKRDQDTV